jgi:hypothetical protein
MPNWVAAEECAAGWRQLKKRGSGRLGADAERRTVVGCHSSAPPCLGSDHTTMRKCERDYLLTPTSQSSRVFTERVAGIGPAIESWEDSLLPLQHTRTGVILTADDEHLGPAELLGGATLMAIAATDVTLLDFCE